MTDDARAERNERFRITPHDLPGANLDVWPGMTNLTRHDNGTRPSTADPIDAPVFFAGRFNGRRENQVFNARMLEP